MLGGFRVLGIRVSGIGALEFQFEGGGGVMMEMKMDTSTESFGEWQGPMKTTMLL